MKRMCLILVALLLVLWGCGKEPEATQPSTEEPEQTQGTISTSEGTEQTPIVLPTLAEPTGDPTPTQSQTEAVENTEATKETEPEEQPTAAPTVGAEETRPAPTEETRPPVTLGPGNGENELPIIPLP